jgi:antirestriction protein ArdC
MHPKMKETLDTIVAELEQGRRPWKPPYQGGAGGLPLRATGEPYRGMNVVLLWVQAMLRGHGSPTWMTYRQAKELGGHVREGEGGSVVVYTDTRKVRETGESGEEEEKDARFLKTYTAFNLAQIDGLPERWYAPDAPAVLPESERKAALEAFVANTGARIQHAGGARPCYMPGPDKVFMPLFGQFNRASGYYATLLHELTHWTGHPGRLARTFGQAFGADAYAREELVAELASVFLCAEMGLEPAIREDHAPYVGHWAEAIKADHKVLFGAAAQGQRAADFLKDLQPKLLERMEGQGAPAAGPA